MNFGFSRTVGHDIHRVVLITDVSLTRGLTAANFGDVYARDNNHGNQ